MITHLAEASRTPTSEARLLMPCDIKAAVVEHLMCTKTKSSHPAPVLGLAFAFPPPKLLCLLSDFQLEAIALHPLHSAGTRGSEIPLIDASHARHASSGPMGWAKVKKAKKKKTIRSESAINQRQTLLQLSRSERRITIGEEAKKQKGIVTALLWLACSHENIDNAKHQINQGANVNSVRSMLDASRHETDVSLLFMTCYRGAFAIAKSLLLSGATDERAIYAVAEGVDPQSMNFRKNMVSILIQRGFDINYITSSGRSALSVAAEIGSIEFVKFLVECGADIEECKDDGHNMMTFVISKCGAEAAIEIVNFLFSNSGDFSQYSGGHAEAAAEHPTLASSWGVHWRRPPPAREPNPREEALVFQQLEIDHYIGMSC
jgi:ankyrin repeat protein